MIHKSIAKNIANTGDGSQQPPRLCCYMNELALDDMPVPGPLVLKEIRAAGYDGFQMAGHVAKDGVADRCRRLGLRMAGSGRVNHPSEADPMAARMADQGFAAGTLHVGWGMEDDDAAHALIEAILEASERRRIPLYPETHRATILQDTWRTVQFIRRYPELRFNGDFSHWYTGQELVYGGFENKFAFLAPVFERVRFLHGRIGNPGCIQVEIDGGETYAGHFREMWKASMSGFLGSAVPGDQLIFTPELLAPGIYYARVFRDAEGALREEGNRWEQSLLLCTIARECFAEAAGEGKTA